MTGAAWRVGRHRMWSPAVFPGFPAWNHNTGGMYVFGCSSLDNGEFMNANAEGLTPQQWCVLEFVSRTSAA